ncbi:endonuclease/exonuclease/phosphatase family protein [Nocardia sp. NPDC005366]|uniref:endonuclease/exonuclease/phosphatase family protein n=1 Tax=Nocardia sp. NPDC005366 TaxID=3156878 RepID=UPI0033B016E7
MSILSGTAPGPPTSSLSADEIFGNTTAGKGLLRTHEWSAFPAVKAAMAAFAGTVEADAEQLDLAVALYRSMDSENAEKLLKANGQGLDLVSAHLSNGGDHSAEQAAQIARLRQLFGSGPLGNIVIGGDFNASSSGNGASAQQIRAFAEQGFNVDAGRIDDGLGGTSASHIPIDHVLPRGVGTSAAERWDRGESDHDGQNVEVTLPAW